ncbi:hypothetical protein GQ54DRAFT_298415 [Martensiomyces pterosporus]|nr:hypothetical protein GQ54DRAFT_298415 [Martensiomyces pterosporus]
MHTSFLHFTVQPSSFPELHAKKDETLHDVAACKDSLRWDEDNIKITEAQKDAKMKVDEPPTPYIRYNPELDADLQEMEDLRLASGASSRSSSVASSPKHAQIAVPADWTSESEEDEDDEEERAKHERFRKLRARHYHLEGKYVHQDAADMQDSDESIESADNGGSSEEDEDVDMRGNGDDEIRRRSPVAGEIGQQNGVAAHPQDVQASKGFKETRCEEEDGRDFAGDVDEINASNMDL